MTMMTDDENSELDDYDGNSDEYVYYQMPAGVSAGHQQQIH